MVSCERAFQLYEVKPQLLMPSLTGDLLQRILGNMADMVGAAEAEVRNEVLKRVVRVLGPHHTVQFCLTNWRANLWEAMMIQLR